MFKFSLTRCVTEPRRRISILLSKAEFTLFLIDDVTFDLSVPGFIDTSNTNHFQFL